MGIWLGPRGKPASKLPPEFTTTGTLGTDYLYAEDTGADGTIYWEIAVLNPCAFTFTRIGDVDLTLVGAGKKGETGQCVFDGVSKADGGGGGDGGDILRVADVQLSTGVSYLFNIGASNGADTTVSALADVLYSSASGTAQSGGTGAQQHARAAHVPATGGNPGEAAFSSGTSLLFPNVKFGPGGGGGAAANISSGTGYGRGSGGETGGGDGGDRDHRVGYDGTANRGAGGGGGFGGFSENSYYGGGTGGSGIALFRGAR